MRPFPTPAYSALQPEFAGRSSMPARKLYGAMRSRSALASALR